MYSAYCFCFVLPSGVSKLHQAFTYSPSLLYTTIAEWRMQIKMLVNAEIVRPIYLMDLVHAVIIMAYNSLVVSPTE